MKILVLGFSVTAERPGYVEIATPELDKRFDAKITKIGLGGLQPYHARYLFAELVKTHDPDVLVLDHATPAFRNFYKDKDDYRRSLLSTLRECHIRSVRVVMIDFPRTDVDYANDWVSALHTELAATLGIPYRRVELTDGILRDEVHPTEFGRQHYAEVLIDCVARARRIEVAPGFFAGTPRYGSVRVCDLVDTEGRLTRIDRGGFVADLVRIAENETLDIPLGQTLSVCGFTALMGPTTGTLKIVAGDLERQQVSYDQFCYYERLGAFLFKQAGAAIPCTTVRLTQTDEIPSVPLLKGEKNTEPRTGAVGHIFTES